MSGPATMTWLGHATIQLTLPDERVILIDPWLSDNPSCPESLKSVPRCDFIALTHGHFDHVGDVASLIDRHNPHVVATVELCTVLGMKSPKGRFAPMNIGGTQTADGVRFSLTRAFHSSGVDSENGPMYAGMPCGVVIGAEGLAGFYHAGDTDVFSDMRLIAELFGAQIAALPIGDHFTMGPRGAALAATYLNPRTILPIHFGTFPLLHGTVPAFREALPAELRDRVVAAEIGQTVAWTAEGLSPM